MNTAIVLLTLGIVVYANAQSAWCGDGVLCYIHVVFYEHANHRGQYVRNEKVFYKDLDCKNFREYENDRASSVDTGGGCIVVYSDVNCEGKGRRIAPGTGCHSNLGDCDMNDEVSSYRRCDKYQVG